MKSSTINFKKKNFTTSRNVILFAFLLLFFLIGVQKVSAQSTQEFKTSTDTLVVYSDVPALAPSDKYSIRVRSAATNNIWVDVFVNYTYNRALELEEIPNSDGVMRSAIVQGYTKSAAGWSHSYGNIEMNTGQAVEVEIASKNGFKIGGQDFFKAKVHPAQKASSATIVEGKIYFTITKPSQIYIDINGQMDDYNASINPIGHPVHPIMLFANPVIKKPSLTDSRVRLIEPGTTKATVNAINPSSYDTMYFKPGVHDIGSAIKMHPGKTYFVPGDAIIYGTFTNKDVPAGSYSSNGENITVTGYGTISSAKIPHYQYLYNYPNITVDEDRVLSFENDRNCKLYGVTLADGAAHTIEFNGDNYPMQWLKTITWRVNGDGLGGFNDAEDCFIRVSDDCSYMKAHRVRCTYWKDFGAAVFHMAGIPEETPQPIVFEDCDVLYLRGGAGFQQRSTGTPGQRKVNVIVRDFRFHDTKINSRVFSFESGSASSFSGILFKNISIAGITAGNMNQILGSSTSPWYGGLTFENITIGGTVLTPQNFPTYFITNQYVNNVVVKTTENFYNITLSASSGGSVYGGGSHRQDQQITVTANPAPAFIFVNWTENGVPISSNANYTFPATQNRSLVANFIIDSTITKVVSLTDWVSGNLNNKKDGNNRLMTVMVMGESASNFSATSASYGSQTMTKQAEVMRTDGSRSYAAIFTLNEAGINAASNGDIVVNWSTSPSSGSSLYSIMLANVDQATPVTANATNSLTGTTVATTPLLAENGQMIILCGATAANNVATVNNSFTKQFESNAAWGDGVGGSKMGSGFSEIPSFSQSVSGRMALCAIAVKNAVAVVKQNQTVTFPTIAAQNFGAADFNAGATSSSGLAVTYTSSNTAVAIILNGNIQIVGAGAADITASQAGNANFNAAVSVVQALTVNKANQTITFPTIAAKTIGAADFNAGATASSGLAVTYTSSNTAVAIIVNGNIQLVGVGSTDITASQAGNTNYNAALSVVQTLTVNTAQTLSNVTAITDWVSGTNNPKVAGTGRLMVVTIMAERASALSINSVTYGGQLMTKQTERSHSSGGVTYASIFTLNETGVNLASSSGAIAVSWNGTPSGIDIYSVMLSNVNQTAPVGAKDNNGAVGTSISTTALATATGDIVVMCGATANNNTITFNNSFTKQFESNSTWGEGFGGFKSAESGTETPKFTQSDRGRMVICGLVVKKSASSASARIAQNEATLSVEENALAESTVKVFPNPVSSILTIESDSQSEKEISVVNLKGQIIFKTKSSASPYQIDLKSLNVSGFIVVKVIADGKVSNHKVIVK